MNRTWLLLRTQLLNYFSVNEIMEPESKKKNTAVIVMFGVITAVLFLCVYNMLTALTLAQAGEQELIPAYMVAISSFAILLLTMLRSNGILFGSKDIDMLSALPVKASEIISSKFLFMYLMNFVVGFVFMVPGGIVWIMNSTADVEHYILYFLSVFFVPLIPMCIAAMIGVLIALASSRFKNRNIFSLFFSFVALGLIGYVGISSMQSGNDVGNIGAMLAGQVSGMYPLSKLFLESSRYPAWIGMIGFLIMSAVIFFLFVKIVAARYNLFNSLASTSSKYSANHKKTQKRQSKFAALYHKEFSRFFSSYMLVLNTGLGVVLLCLFSIAILIIAPEKLGGYVGIEDMNGFLSQYAPVVVGALLSLSCPAASSISLEGENIWILQSSPVSVKTILNSKLAVNLTLHGFGYTLAVLAIITRLKMSALQIISLLLVPVVYSLFTAVLGIFLNKKYPNYEWENEMMVVKQSIPAIVTGIVSMVIVAVPVLLNWILGFPIMPTIWIAVLIILIMTFVLYQKACASKFI